MKVKMFDKEWEVKNPTYKEKRELWKLNTMTFVSDKINQDKYFELLDKVEEISGLQPEDYINKKGDALNMANIDSLLQQIFLSYIGQSEEAKKAYVKWLMRLQNQNIKTSYTQCYLKKYQKRKRQISLT